MMYYEDCYFDYHESCPANTLDEDPCECRCHTAIDHLDFTPQCSAAGCHSDDTGAHWFFRVKYPCGCPEDNDLLCADCYQDFQTWLHRQVWWNHGCGKRYDGSLLQNGWTRFDQLTKEKA